jgi:hypothetical protein
LSIEFIHTPGKNIYGMRQSYYLDHLNRRMDTPWRGNVPSDLETYKKQIEAKNKEIDDFNRNIDKQLLEAKEKEDYISLTKRE